MPVSRFAQGYHDRSGHGVARWYCVKEAILGGLAAVILGMSAGSPHVVAAFGSTRTISFFHIHTKETLTITYKKDGQVRPRRARRRSTG